MKTSARFNVIRWWCAGRGLAEPEPEFRFAPPRRWRFDAAWPDLKVAVELDGSVYARGRHTRGQGYEGDCEKLNEAAARGWTVFRLSTGQFDRGDLWPLLERVLV